MTLAPLIERREIAVRGIVQGVGFRPFVYSLARRLGLTGIVRNDADGVHIEIEGTAEQFDAFLHGLRKDAPPLAVIEAVSCRSLAPRGDTEFQIELSQQSSRQRQALISPDVSVCADCYKELFDPSGRRYRYPFINCTNCGPRFTITYSVPYDRAATTMATFPLCPVCKAEYEDPANRRFHAQPNACPACGPRVQLLDRQGDEVGKNSGDAVLAAANLLRDGAILAVKGLGGFHLACNPFHSLAVDALRARKVRQDKPFALMANSLEQARELCHVAPEEQALLTAPARPIVLLARRQDAAVADAVAPRQQRLGVMLAYTPLHHLLLHDTGIPLVMTSGNRCDEPIAYRDSEVFEQLGGIADYVLVHNRAIHMRCDDSVVRLVDKQIYPLRRSRGYAPAPLDLARRVSRHILACGGELKNTFCLAKERHAFLSHHIGDLENYETLRSFSEGIEHYCRLFAVRPEIVAYDLHPEYLSTKYALDLEEKGMRAIGIQHHHAHIAACLADNRRPTEERVIGVALDGTGYGTDGAIWGGEFFAGSIEQGFTRRGHLEYVPLPGGTAAIRQPWRMATSYLLMVYGEERVMTLPLAVMRQAGERNVRIINRLVQNKMNSPLTSSAGRLFDAVAALVGVPGSDGVTYEGQAAVELELAAPGAVHASDADSYGFHLRNQGQTWVVETREIITGVVDDVLASLPTSAISSRFHNTMAEVVVAGCQRIRAEDGPEAVALSGGTFQNMLLLNQTIELLRKDGFTVYIHRRVPANDGGIALGQAVLADSVIRARDGERRQPVCA